MRETKNLEFKECFTRSFLKTVSAFANYSSGKIIFGRSDDGEIKEINNIKETCLAIENSINDSISPSPEYSLDIKPNSTIELQVKQGYNTPYFYKNKAYKRNNTSTVQVNTLELNRLILKGQNITFEEQEADNQNLEFSILESWFNEKLNIKKFDKNILITLQLFNDGKYNNAAALLSDKNNFPGLDIAVFGTDINVFKKRCTLSQISVLEQYETALKIFDDNYIIETINNKNREKNFLIPYDAIRETIANSLIHRAWDVKANTTIYMFDDRIEIVSPGGLPEGMSFSDYLDGGISILSNRILANVFYRLGLIEQFGTGIRRIKQAYTESVVKPDFIVNENKICVVLPILHLEKKLNYYEKLVYAAVNHVAKSSTQIADDCGISKTKTVQTLNELVQKSIIYKLGSGRGTKYIRRD